MTNLFLLIFWSCFGLSVLASIIALIHLRVPRERGPWLVCRVAADGSGGVEFYKRTGIIWTNRPEWAYQFKNIRIAKLVSKNNLADVVPLSRYIGKGNSK